MDVSKHQAVANTIFYFLISSFLDFCCVKMTETVNLKGKLMKMCVGCNWYADSNCI